MLKAENLRHSYGNRVVLNDISLTLDAGKILCLMGASGCGKSTLLNLLSGLMPTQEGSISSTVARPGPQLGYMTQESDLLPWLTLKKNVTLGSSLHPDIAVPSHDLLQEMFDQFDLKGCEGMYPHELSGGQVQRAILIRTLLSTPRLLLLDEPLGHLDEVRRVQAIRKIRHYVAAHNAAALIVTHQLQEAVQLGDQILMLSEKPTRILHSYHLDSSSSRREAFMALSEILANDASALYADVA